MIKSFRDLKVYQKAYQMSLELHEKSLTFPAFEKYELGSQIRRATKSIAMNIAEGYARNASIEDFRRFLIMAIGSCDEVQVQLDYCRDLEYITQDEYEYFRGQYEEVGKMLSSMIKTWRKYSSV